MKKIFFILIMIVLSGCTTLVCRNYSENHKQKETCMMNDVFQTLTGEGKTEDEIFNILQNRSQIIEPYGYQAAFDAMYCFAGRTELGKPRSRYVSPERCLNLWKQMEIAYKNFIIEQRRVEIERAQLEEEERQKEIKKTKQLKNKWGVDWCSPKDVISLIATRQGNLPKDCMFELNYLASAFFILQQTADGTLIHIPEDNIIYFVEKNNIDSEYVDNAVVRPGVFINTGIYQYDNTFGSTKTVYKLKRIE